MKRQKGGGLSISHRVTRSTTTFDRNSLTLPVEIVTEIFLRLPLKSIARCRCVCKLWSSVIRSQDFTDSFFTKSCSRPRLLFVFDDEDEGEIHFFSSSQPKDNSYVVATNHIARSPDYYKLFGCTNGFFCYGARQGRNKPVLVTVIYNPSTGQSFTLPRLNPKLRYAVRSYLGYDPIAKRFKVLSVCDDGKEFHVLTLGTKKLSWRVVECCIPHCSSHKWICISGVLYYIATESTSSVESMVVCFDLRTEKFSSVKLLGGSNKTLPDSTTMIKYDGRLGLLMSSSEDSGYVSRLCKSFKLWVLRDAAKHEWSKRVYVLPPLWKDVVSEDMFIAGMVGTSEIVLSPFHQEVPSYVIYFNVESKTVRKVGIQGMDAFQGEMINTHLNYVENVELL
ncbi:putative F-box protein At3g23960 [Raphanus sativus]|uniref:F-box protein At3g23960 n=1 Tax=Raphanus sativus TaxID=3726 RepID=A0A6J0NMG3_RAPSA|nr:putative F-box protein At3g23960 [Raphanus sativus]